MSTKRIERTVIEGGRSSVNKYVRRESSQLERMESRQMLRVVKINPDLSDEEPMPMRKPVRKDFRDKLNPAYRWLLKRGKGMQVPDLQGMILGSFDIRTVPGQHIVFDHLMPRPFWEGRWYTGAGTIDPKRGLIHDDQAWRKGQPGKKGSRIKRKKARIQMRQTKARDKRVTQEQTRMLDESRIKDPQVRKLLGLD